MLRAELAFYIGCLNLRESLVGVDEPVCVPGSQAVPSATTWRRTASGSS
jgi:hypothetical protein